ncbi:MAG: hypothetical protein U0361_07290 [Nitrospiraceae bacterium]
MTETIPSLEGAKARIEPMLGDQKPLSLKARSGRAEIGDSGRSERDTDVAGISPLAAREAHRMMRAP